jgi:hypothetical protein
MQQETNVDMAERLLEWLGTLVCSRRREGHLACRIMATLPARNMGTISGNLRALEAIHINAECVFSSS